MNVNVEYCDPFDEQKDNFWMKVEHSGRYLWAAEWLCARGCEFVADIACANGYGSRILAERIRYVVGVDRNETYLALAEGAPNNDGVTFICCDLDHAPMPERLTNVDAVVCFETLEHLIDPQAALKKIFKILRPEGFLLMSVPNEKYERTDENGNNEDPFHLHIFSREDIIDLLNTAGFRVLETLGQDICNRVVSRISEVSKAGIMPKQEIEHLWTHDKSAVKAMSYLLGYPDSGLVSESYSHIYICEKRE